MNSSPIERSRRRVAPLTALLLVLTLLTGCSAALSGGASSDGGGVQEPQVEGSEDLGGDEADRQVVSTASISLAASDPIAVADDAVGVALEAGGHVDSRTDSPAEEPSDGSAQLVLRVPSGSLDATLIELKALGELLRSSLNETDVTTQSADLDARITALETSVSRLLTMMSQATTTADLIDLEAALSERQSELDGLTAQRDSLRDSVDLATVEMYITTPGEVAGAAPGDFWGGVVVGFTSLISFVGGLLVVLGIALPWLVPLALLAALVVWLVRRRRPAGSARPPGSPGYPDQPLPPPPPLPTEVASTPMASPAPPAGSAAQSAEAATRKPV